MSQIELLTHTLKQNSQSVTKQRLAVFTVLQGQEPLSIREIIARCAGTDRASVYRTLDLFEQLGIVQRIQTGWKYKLELSDTFHAHHHHATCLHCGRTIVLHADAALEELLSDIAHDQNFVIAAHQLELQGYCSDCRQ